MNLMQQIIRLSLYFLVGLFLSGCTKDYKIDIQPNLKPSLVVNGLITAGETPTLYISKTVPYYHKDKINHADYKYNNAVEHAHVKMYLDGKMVEEQDLHRSAPEKFILEFNSKTRVSPHQLVRFEIKGDNMPTAIFEERMPNAPTIVSCKIDSIETTNNRFSNYHTMVKGQDTDFTFNNYRDHFKGPYINYIAQLQVSDHQYPNLSWTGVAIFNNNYKILKSYSDTWKINNQIKQVPIWTGNDPLFSKKCNDLMKHFNENHNHRRDLDSIKIAYFSNNRLTQSNYELTLQFPKLFLSPNYKFAVYAINYTYYKLAEDKYNEDTDDDDDDDDDFDIDESSGLIERKPTWSNIKNGTGVILLRSGSYVTWHTAP